jgi:16S rRNA U516 pseudouridylate synthase RsuA-like enzyme
MLFHLMAKKLNLTNMFIILMNKPKGVVTTTDDEKKRMTVTDLLNQNKKYFLLADWITTQLVF